MVWLWVGVVDNLTVGDRTTSTTTLQHSTEKHKHKLLWIVKEAIML